MKNQLVNLSLAAVVAAFPATVFAQDAVPEDLSAEKVLDAKTDKPDGWKLKLTVGGTGSYGHSSNVVGAVDGGTTQLGVLVDGSAVLTHGQHTWENVLGIKETQTRTPQIASFIKSTDELKLKSTYLYNLESIDWLGPYARASLATQLLRSYDVRTDAVNIVRNKRDGTSVTLTRAPQDRIALTKPFEPALLRESAGLFANPLTSDLLTVKAKLGAGFQHIFVRNGYALSDDDATPEIEYRQLQSSTQGGAELEAEATGNLVENVTWSASANFFYPVYTSVDTELSGTELLNTELAAKLSVRLAKWASLDYVFSAKKLPLILEEWQIQNGVLLTAGFNIL